MMSVVGLRCHGLAKQLQALDLLETQRWILRILFKVFVGLIRKFPDILRQRPVAGPEVRGRMMVQRGVVFPAA